MQTGGSLVVKKTKTKNEILRALFSRIKSEEFCPVDFDSIKIEKIEDYYRDAFMIQYEMTDRYTAEVGTRVLETHQHLVWYTDEKGRSKQKTVKDDVWETHWKDFEDSITQRYFSIVFADDPQSNTIDKNNRYVERFRKLSDENMVDEPSDDKPIDVPQSIIEKATDYGVTKIKNSAHIDGFDRVRERRDKITYITEAAVAIKYPYYKITYSYKDSKYESIFDANNGEEYKYSPIIERKFDNEIRNKAKNETSKYALVRNISLCVALVSFVIFATSLEMNIKTTICVIIWIVFFIILLVERNKFGDVYKELKKGNDKVKEDAYDKFISNNIINENDAITNELLEDKNRKPTNNIKVVGEINKDEDLIFDSELEKENYEAIMEDFKEMSDYLENEATDEELKEFANEISNAVNLDDEEAFSDIDDEYDRNAWKEIRKYEKNGLIYHVYGPDGMDDPMLNYEVPEYNEVLVYYTFLEKYHTIKRPDLLDDSFYPHRMFFVIGVEKPKKVHKELFDKGFYSIASSKEILETYKVGEIRKIIERLELNIRGRKDKLIDELVKQADKNKLTKILGDKTYSISDYGKEWMEEHKSEYEHYIYGDSIDMTEEEILQEYEDRINSDDRNYGRTEYIGRAGHYKQNEEYKKALIDIMTIVYIDLSCVDTYNLLKIPNKDRYYKVKSTAIFAPGILRMFKGLTEYYEPNLVKEVFKKDLPINANTPELFSEIMNDIVNNTLTEEKKKEYLDKISDNFQIIVKKFD